jgi:hypothetical protein
MDRSTAKRIIIKTIFSNYYLAAGWWEEKHTHTHTSSVMREISSQGENVSKKEDEIISSHVWIGGTVTFSMEKKFLVSLSAAVNQLWRCYTSPEKCSLWLLRVKHAEEHGKFPLSAIRMSSFFLSVALIRDMLTGCLTVHLCMTCWMACDELCATDLSLFFTRLVKNRNDTIQVKWKIQPGNLSEFLFPYVRPGPLKCFFSLLFLTDGKRWFSFPIETEFFYSIRFTDFDYRNLQDKRKKKDTLDLFPLFWGVINASVFLVVGWFSFPNSLHSVTRDDEQTAARWLKSLACKAPFNAKCTHTHGWSDSSSFWLPFMVTASI